ncbi:MAG: hypothetical protein AAFR59_14090 [Bacteroidota bacterium]
MADVSVNFLHPTDGRQLSVTLDDSITAQEAVAELIAAEFIAPSSEGYGLAIKGGSIIGADQSFENASVRDNTTIRVLPATDAGDQIRCTDNT